MNASRSEILRRVAYLAASVTVIASQNLVAWIARQAYADERPLDLEFWLTPLSSTLELWGLPAIGGAVIFAYCLLVAWLLALLSFKLAQRTNRGFVLAVLSVVPVVQLAAIATNAILPSKDALDEEGQATRHASKSVALGLLAGVALIVFAVLISAVTFGAYGWGLFVMTPFLVGITTGYLVNSENDLGSSRTMKLAIASAGLGSLALVVLALEGIVCILLAAPLAVPIVMLGAALGRGLAIARHNRRTPLASVAVLPMIFMLEAATQAGAWLLRLSENFSHSMISLKEARNVKYADFVQPGQTLEVTVSMLKKDDRLASFKMEGQMNGRTALTGRLELERYNLADTYPERRPIDELLINHFRRMETFMFSTRRTTTG